MKIVNLRCGYKKNPTQISRENVCFSWGTENSGNQKAYRLQISHDENFKSIYVDTQKVESSSNKFIQVKAKLSRATKYYWRVKVYSESGEESWSETAFFETMHKGFDAKWIANPKERNPQEPAPSTRFRKEFKSEGKVKSARLYASAQGLYVAYINGKKCGDEFLTPGWTEYTSRIQYQTYDVTNLIKDDYNCIGAVVSDGWFMGPVAGWEDNSRCRFGDRRAFFAQLEIDYEDDSFITVISDSSWQTDRKSAYTRCEIYHGADYDSRRCDSFFKYGHLAKSTAEEIKQNSIVIPSQGVPVKKINTMIPKEILVTPKGEIVIDMGQNMVGVPEISVEGKLGQEIELVFFETLDKSGNVHTTNLRSARQGLNYVLDEGKNTFIPEMTFYGFRYIHVKNWPGEVKKENIKGLVLASDMQRTGYLKTNNETVNRFIENVLWGQIGNYVDVPTDCPQRDERLGWTGDAQVFIKAAAFNYDILSFFDKWLGDMSYSQTKEGAIPHVVPDCLKDGHSSAGWGEACAIIPWQLYVRYGDIGILEKCYPMMQTFIDYRTSTATSDGIINTGFHFGDWLALDRISILDRYPGATPFDLICTAYYAHTADIMAKAAKALGKKKDAKKYVELFGKIKSAFNKEFVTCTGRVSGNTQTSYILALEFDLLDEKTKKRAADEFAAMVRDHKSITCGFMGAPHILDVLTDNGHHDLALMLALKEEYPSWLYPVTMGATTVWEHWNSVFPDGEVNPTQMNSLNHYAYGAAVNWYYEKVAGIVPDPENPGYKHFYLNPKPCKELNTIDCHLTTHYGTIRVYYEMTENDVRMRLSIPDNTTAHLTLEDCKAFSLDCSRKKYSGSIMLESGIHDVAYVKGGTFLSTVPEV